MTKPTEMSSDLEDWAGLAGFSLTRQSVVDDRAMFWNNGGETRYFVGQRQDGWFIVTCSDRMGPEYLVFAAPEISTVEVYFYSNFGADIRDTRSLPSASAISGKPERLAGGFQMHAISFEGEECQALYDSAGQLVAVDGGDLFRGSIQVAKLAVYLTSSVEDIKRSFLAPDGKPLLAVR